MTDSDFDSFQVDNAKTEIMMAVEQIKQLLVNKDCLWFLVSASFGLVLFFLIYIDSKG